MSGKKITSPTLVRLPLRNPRRRSDSKAATENVRLGATPHSSHVVDGSTRKTARLLAPAKMDAGHEKVADGASSRQSTHRPHVEPRRRTAMACDSASSARRSADFIPLSS